MNSEDEATSPADAASLPDIVAIGVSAGGLDALEAFFIHLPAGSRQAFVIVDHLSADFKALMIEMLARQTPLPVVEIEDGMAPMAATIHVAPPGVTLALREACFHLDGSGNAAQDGRIIDHFFTDLAKTEGARAIGVILSGSGSDGRQGVEALIEAGGRVLVQRPETARFASMPQQAIATGRVREVLAPEGMGAALIGTEPDRGEPAVRLLEPVLLQRLGTAFDLDISMFEPMRLSRLFFARMKRLGLEDEHEFVELVLADEEERSLLYAAMMLGEDSLFADPEAFAALERVVLRQLVPLLDQGAELRLWVPGVGRGEDAYGLAMLLCANSREGDLRGRVKIFATDTDRRTLARAADGRFSSIAVGGLPAVFRTRFFEDHGDHFQIVPALRQLVVFSRHDLLDDPPFTRIDLICCRSLLSLLTREAREQALDMFGYGLRVGGLLVLAPGDQPAGREDTLFPVEGLPGIYRCSGAPERIDLAGRMASLSAGEGRGRQDFEAPRERRDPRLAAARELLLDTYVPPSLLVDEHGEVLHSFGNPDPWLKPPVGRASLRVVDMVLAVLRAPLAAAFSRARQSAGLAVVDGGQLTGTGLERVLVRPLIIRAGERPGLLVTFEPEPSGAPAELEHDMASDAGA